MGRLAVRAILAAVVLLVGLVVLGAQGGSVRWPWRPACTLVDAAGATLASGSTDEFVALLDHHLGTDGASADGGSPDVDTRELSDALAAGPTLACTIGAVSVTGATKDPTTGLTPNARAMRRAVRATFGDLADGGYGTDILPGRIADGEHSRGRAVDFFFRPYSDDGRVARGWMLANWAVANAERLHIRTVIFSDHIWSARRSAQGWRPYRFSGADPDNPVNRHLDHVHIDVG